jgi:hypothetical protein
MSRGARGQGTRTGACGRVLGVVPFHSRGMCKVRSPFPLPLPLKLPSR